MSSSWILRDGGLVKKKKILTKMYFVIFWILLSLRIIFNNPLKRILIEKRFIMNLIEKEESERIYRCVIMRDGELVLNVVYKEIQVGDSYEIWGCYYGSPIAGLCST